MNKNDERFFDILNHNIFFIGDCAPNINDLKDVNIVKTSSDLTRLDSLVRRGFLECRVEFKPIEEQATDMSTCKEFLMYQDRPSHYERIKHYSLTKEGVEKSIEYYKKQIALKERYIPQKIYV